MYLRAKRIKLSFHIESPNNASSKPRHVKLEIKTAVGNCFWSDEFEYEATMVRTKDNFFNLEFRKNFIVNDTLTLNGSVTVREMDWKESNSSMTFRETRCEKITRDIHVLVTSGTLSDFTFIVEDRPFQVYKAILAGE